MIIKEEKKQSVNRCNAPWKSLVISQPSKKVMPCCYYRGENIELDLDADLDINKIWNDERMQKVRYINSDSNRKKEAEGCKNCQFFESTQEYADGSVFKIIKDDSSEIQKNNQKQAIKDYEASNLTTKAAPTGCIILFGSLCNINCIMCWEAIIRQTEEKSSLKADWLLKAKSELIKMNQIMVSGGECLLMPESVKFIKAIVEDSDFNDTNLVVYTNATLLGKYLDLLKKKKKIMLNVSLDSIGSTYEYIRKGAKWDIVEQNLLKFKEIAKENDREWKINTINILMKSSIDRIEEFARWSVKNDIAVVFTDFSEVSGMEKVFEEENIFANPLLLDQVLHWETKLDTAIEIFEKAGNQKVAVESLTNYRKKINKAYLDFKHNKINPATTKERLPIHQKIKREIAYFFNKIKNKLNK